MNRLLGLLFLSLSFAVQADLSGKVVKIVDGDTIDILKDETVYRIRLDGIDAPEKNQAFGQRARQYLSQLISQKRVVAKGDKKDKYGRMLSTIYYREKDINAMMISRGLAWAYRNNKGKAFNAEYELLEEEAKTQKIGLWIDDNAMAPWDWRKRKSTGKK